MSQYPPPGGPPMYPPNVPPGGPGGFGPPGYSLPSQSRTSAAAVTSLICGLLGCVPGVTGLIAVITGIIGISRTGNPAIKGRGMAIAGLILGLISLAGWGTFALGGYGLYRAGAPARAFAKQYITDLSAGNEDKCLQDSTANLSKDRLDSLAQAMKPWGTLNDVKVFGFSVNNNNGVYAGVVSGVCTFSGGTHTFQMTLSKDPSGNLKADTLMWQN
jgi:hypothetical protein